LPHRGISRGREAIEENGVCCQIEPWKQVRHIAICKKKNNAATVEAQSMYAWRPNGPSVLKFASERL
jgi:hypothetical protein